MNIVNERIRRVRELLCMNQHQMAVNSGLTQRDISRIESGKAKFIPSQFMQFLHRIGVNMNYLYGDKDALPFAHSSTHLNEKYEKEKELFPDDQGINLKKESYKNYHFDSDLLIRLIDNLEGDEGTKEKLKNEFIKLLMELSESKDKIIHLMRHASKAVDPFNRNN